MPEVEIGFGPVLRHIDLAVLIRGHRAWVDVEVGVVFLMEDLETPALQKESEARGEDSLAQRRNDAAGNDDELGHNALQKNNGPILPQPPPFRKEKQIQLPKMAEGQ